MKITLKRLGQFTNSSQLSEYYAVISLEVQRALCSCHQEGAFLCIKTLYNMGYYFTSALALLKMSRVLGVA